MISRIFLDIDGVVADWQSAVIRLYSLEPREVYARWPRGVYDLAKVLHVSTANMHRRVNMCGAVFWASLDCFSWTGSLYSLAKRTAPTTFLSQTSTDSHSGSGKMQWLDCHFRGVPFFIGSENKGICAAPRRVLIDDKDSNCVDFIQAGGEAIVFPQPWNSRRAWAHNRMAYVRAQLGEL